MKYLLGNSWLVLLLGFMSVGLIAKPVPRTAPVVTLAVDVTPGQVTKGAPCLFVVTSPEPVKSLAGKWLGKNVFFNPDASRRKWYGLAGVSLETKLGGYPLTIAGTAANGRPVNQQITVKVVLIPISKGDIRVPNEFLHPDEDQREQIKEDVALKQKAFGTETLDRLWEGSFNPPVDTEIRATFGGGRTFNQTAKRIHKGVDYRAATGTAIKAANSGRVILARSMFYDGNMITIDHGQGLLTMYLHLSKIKVKEGDLVKTGQEIGLSGKTGRASGPHLHFQVKWERIDIDPVRLMKIELPTNLSR